MRKLVQPRSSSYQTSEILILLRPLVNGGETGGSAGGTDPQASGWGAISLPPPQSLQSVYCQKYDFAGIIIKQQ